MSRERSESDYMRWLGGDMADIVVKGDLWVHRKCLCLCTTFNGQDVVVERSYMCEDPAHAPGKRRSTSGHKNSTIDMFPNLEKEDRDVRKKGKRQVQSR